MPYKPVSHDNGAKLLYLPVDFELEGPPDFDEDPPKEQIFHESFFKFDQPQLFDVFAHFCVSPLSEFFPFEQVLDVIAPFCSSIICFRFETKSYFSLLSTILCN